MFISFTVLVILLVLKIDQGENHAMICVLEILRWLHHHRMQLLAQR